ncbi:ATP-binding protein [Candidatus Daviesbacteria bacterium]|nr:ATP-binding protein [Candidatus Daviesbacteria bacterium]
MLIDRSILTRIQKQLMGEPKIIIIYGPRQSGKTTLINQLLNGIKSTCLIFTGDDLRTQELFGIADLDRLKKIVGANKLLVIDEAQRIQNIGLVLKLLFDSLKIHIIASGSSSFDLANKINEPLTGRSVTFTLYPLGVPEVPKNILETVPAKIGEFLRFGLYPKVITLSSEAEKELYLNELINNYLYKDVLSFETIRKPKKIIDLLSLLALQIGSEVSIQELAQNLSLSKIIVEKYLDLLGKMFVIINIRGFSRNLRKEISKTSKYYFVDLGLRNALIRNFNPLNLRTDKGVMFENLCVIERLKTLENSRKVANLYFWRTYDQKEIDLIEEKEGRLTAFEFKFTPKKTTLTSAGKEFTSVYKNSTYKIIYPNNFEQFLNN